MEGADETGIKWKGGKSEANNSKLKDDSMITSFYLSSKVRLNKMGQKIEKMLSRMEKIKD